MLVKVKDSNLKIVSGGNYWDVDKDNNPSQSWYQVGQQVNVYSHWTHKDDETDMRSITNKSFEDGHWIYTYNLNTYSYDKWDQPLPVTITKTITASDIQR